MFVCDYRAFGGELFQISPHGLRASGPWLAQHQILETRHMVTPTFRSRILAKEDKSVLSFSQYQISKVLMGPSGAKV